MLLIKIINYSNLTIIINTKLSLRLEKYIHACQSRHEYFLWKSWLLNSPSWITDETKKWPGFCSLGNLWKVRKNLNSLITGLFLYRDYPNPPWLICGLCLFVCLCVCLFVWISTLHTNLQDFGTVEISVNIPPYWYITAYLCRYCSKRVVVEKIVDEKSLNQS